MSASAEPRPCAGISVRCALIRTLGVAGKDAIRYWPVPLVIVVGALAVFTAQRSGVFGPRAILGPETTSIAAHFYAALLALGFATGLALSTEEEESGTRRLLDALPMGRLRLLAGKAAAGAMLLAFGGLLDGVSIAFASGERWGFLSRIFAADRALSIFVVLPLTPWVLPLAGMSFLLTGLVCGTLFGNLAVAALAGGVCQMGYLALAELLRRELTATDGGSAPYSAAVLLVWCGAMLCAYPVAFTAGRETEGRSGLPWISVLRALRPGRRAPAMELSVVAGRQLRIVFYVLAVPCLLLPLLRQMKSAPGLWMQTAAVVIPASAALLGACALRAEERDRMRFFVYALPVSRQAILWTRLRELIKWALLLTLLTGAGFLAAGAIWDTSDTAEHALNPMLALALLACVTIWGALAACLVSLFQRQRIISVVLGAVCCGYWGVATSCSALNTMAPDWTRWTWETACYVIWAFAAGTGLLLVALRAAFAASPLPEMQESGRGLALIAVYPVLLVWGRFIISMSPYDVWRAVFG